VRLENVRDLSMHLESMWTHSEIPCHAYRFEACEAWGHSENYR